MFPYRRIFRRRNTFLAVIHVQDEAQTLRNARIAFGEGADGIFLINHSVSEEKLSLCYEAVRGEFQKEWIGINWLSLSPLEGLSMMKPSMNGIWVDNAGVYEDMRGTADARIFSDQCCEWENKNNTEILIFGGVAFKYQERVQNLERAARLALPYIDVITTSGDGTGIAADIEKIRTMKNATDDYPLAIASGITPENVQQYMEHADCFLVATGISDSHTELNPARVRKLAKALS